MPPACSRGADSIVLNIPGAQPAASVGRQQATALVKAYLSGTREETLTLQAVRSTGRRFFVPVFRSGDCLQCHGLQHPVA